MCKISGRAEISRILKVEGSFGIEMPDTVPRGVCTVTVKAKGHLFGREFDIDQRFENVKYTTGNGKLYLFLPPGRAQLYDHDRKWTWLHPGITGLPWIGIWPAGEELTLDDMVEQAG